MMRLLVKLVDVVLLISGILTLCSVLLFLLSIPVSVAEVKISERSCRAWWCQDNLLGAAVVNFWMATASSLAVQTAVSIGVSCGMVQCVG